MNDAVTSVLSREHQVVLKTLDGFEAAIEIYDVDAIRDVLRFFDERLVLHRRKEEEVLFPMLAPRLGEGHGPVACMLQEHADEKEKIEEMRAALAVADTPAGRQRIVWAGRYIIGLLRNHIAKEDHILFRMAEEVLGDEEKARVKAGMDAIETFAEPIEA